MPDNIELNAGSGGAIIATDQDAGLAQHQYVKVEWGPDNTQTKVDTGASALPIQDGGNSITVDGSVTANAGANLNTSALALESGGNLATIAALSKAEDAAHVTGDPGVMLLGVRNDNAATTLVNANGDYTPIATDSTGRLWVNTIGAISSSVNPGTAATSLGKAEDAAHTTGDTGVAILSKRTDTAASSAGTDGDYATINTDAAGRLWVNGSNVTQPISAASLPLPSGAATAAKQPALGTAGSASADVISVQGIASMTALKVDGSAVTQPVSGTFWQATQPVSIAATVTTTEAGRTAVVHFQASIPTTAGGTALASNACKEATVKNLLSNSNIIWVGVNGVTSSTGYELNPGEALTLKVSNTNLIYCLSASGSQSVCVIATN